jgi:23S rRNA (guanosine2251-2'-O)-methyltransferase
MPTIVLLVHNIRSTHNVGAIFRSAEGFGVSHIYLSGYSPYPKLEDDLRLPHIADLMTKKISKTALGAEASVPFSYHESPPLELLKQQGFAVVGLEQEARSQNIREYDPPKKLGLLLGEEVEGIEERYRKLCDELIEIPMVGKKESFNVSVATGIALYALTAHD